MRIIRIYFLLLSALSLFPYTSTAESATDIESLTAAAAAFLGSLNATQLEIAQQEFHSDTREDWHYFPKQRKGLAWREMSPEQKDFSWALFRTALSESGSEKVEGIVSLEKILWERSNKRDFLHPGKYYVTIFGKPATNTSWGASLEGHHLSINLTVVDGREVFVTPSFFGASPDEVKRGDQVGLRPLKGEALEALKLLKMLDPEQRKSAIISDKAPREILTGADREANPQPLAGLSASAMNEVQQKQLRRLLAEYVDRYRAPYAKVDWAKIDAAGFDKIYFAWAGSEEMGEPMYYRVQGPSFIMEYVNVQNGGNHSHTVWRDFENDFGRDYLKEHLDSAH